MEDGKGMKKEIRFLFFTLTSGKCPNNPQKDRKKKTLKNSRQKMADVRFNISNYIKSKWSKYTNSKTDWQSGFLEN